MSVPLPLQYEVGIKSDPTPTDAVGRWKDANHVRFNRDYPEKIGGWVSLLDDSDEPVLFKGVARSLFDWSDLNSDQWTAIGTSKKLYIYRAGVIYDITPTRRTVGITNGVSTSVTGAFDPDGDGDARFVRVFDASHGARTGDIVELTTEVTIGGVSLLGEYEIRDVLDVDAYIVRAATAATSTVSDGGGAVTLRYDISAGAEAAMASGGYGVGLYGGGLYGVSDDDETFVVPPRLWSMENWGEDLLASPSNGTLYWWQRSGGPEQRAVVRPNAPDRIRRMLLMPEERRVLALGATTAGGQDDDMFIRWCDAEDFDQWTILEANTAGARRVENGSRIITGLRTRLGTLIWTDRSLHILQPVGPPDIYGIDMLADNTSILSPNSAIDVQGLVMWMGVNNFYVYDGTVRVLPCDVWDFVFNDINLMQGFSVYCAINELFREVTWYYTSTAGSTNNRSVTYNYELRCWYYSRTGRTAAKNLSPSFNRPYATAGGEGDSDVNRGRIYLHEVGADADGEPLSAYIESWDQYLPGVVKHAHISAIRPDFKRMVNDVDLIIRYKRRPQQQTYSEKVYPNVTIERERISVRVHSRQIAIRWESDGLGDDWRLGDMEAEIIAHGGR